MGSTYATINDLTSRLSSSGLLYLVDDDDNGSLSPTETSYLTDALRFTAPEIDMALDRFVNFPFDGSGNDWLVRIHLDLACAWLSARKGGKVAEDLQKSADLAREWLERVRNFEIRVPGLVYPIDSWNYVTRELGKVKIHNPLLKDYKKWPN
jgi:phage gp36-like protein